MILSNFHPAHEEEHVHEFKVGLMVPLYVHPGSKWDDLIEVKHHHPTIPFVAIINPSNGPGSTLDSNYTDGIEILESSGIVVLGYVDTNYGVRNSTTLESEIDSYKNWYGVNGIFFDQMANVPGKESYYANLTKYVKTHGMIMSVGNPGVDTMQSYVGTVDNLVLYDNANLPPLSLFNGWHENFNKRNFSFLSYGVGSLDDDYIKSLKKHVGYLYVTDQNGGNPWNALPPYLDKLVEELQSSEPFVCHASKC
ncbi:MAG: spherulation-specific family 4 protein [Thaumarchaeota archaeon]|nr:spherulation-specific family 4 protein [Nitrososphaerota archaeon]